ncbi:MAG: YeeE/YedE family protein [Thiobacillus sp.]|nr:YeeE/YedE family protein [Thiobacillus sp.]
MRFLPYLLAGVIFGFVMIKSEAASWYRIMEMFYFQSFHMYGIMMSAIATGMTGVLLLKRYGRLLTLDGQPIEIPKKEPGHVNYILGGFIFGLGWGVIGLCPGPIFSLVGMGSIGALAALAGALHGTWLYGFVKNRLPH